MANLIDTSFFYGDLSIAQITDAAVANTVTRVINEREPELLLALFGYELYKNYQAGIIANTPKYIDIRDGKEYTNRAGRLTKWRGLKETVVAPVIGPPAVAGQYRSLIANYVYYWHMRNNATASTGTGEKTAKAQNATDASPRQKMASAWNQMVQWNCKLVEFLLSNQSDYPEFLNHYSCRELDNLLTTINPIF